MDFSRIMWDNTWVCVVLPLLIWLIWWCNDIWYVVVKLKSQRRIIKGTKLPPGHMGLPFFGEMLLFLWYFKIVRRPDDYIHSKRHKYGDGIGLYRTHLFGSPTIIACSPMVNKFVLQSDSNFILEWPTEELLGTTSLFATRGEGHTRLRAYVERTINQPKALRRIALVLQPRLIAALKSWSEKKTVVAFKESKKVTFENIGRLFASFEPGPILDNLELMFTGLTHGFRSSPINFPGTAFHHALQCRKNIIKIFGEELKNRKKNKKSEVDSANHRDDVMDGLMRLKDTDGNQLSDIEILDNIASLVIGGYMSTSLAMMWTLYYLAISPNVLQKLRDENMLLSKSKNGELITSDDVAKLTYTNQVVEEILRLGNLAWLLFRRVTKDVEYKGYTIPKGWKVLLWSRYIHTNPENFEDPLCFNPDRWNAATKPKADQIFGGGPRICAGNMLARLQLALVIHHLATGYKWELVNPNAKVVYLPHPKPVDGVEIAFTKL